MTVSFELDTRGVIGALEDVAKTEARASEIALRRTALWVIARSQRVHVPVDTGYLRSTGYTDKPQSDLAGWSVQLGFWSEYAIYVHEDLDANHPNGGSAKYLTLAMDEAKNEQILERELQKAWRM
jgi:hypothetical protein